MHLGLNQHGRSFYSWSAEENVNASSFGVPGSAAGTLLYPNGPQAEYYPQASFVSSRGYGFLLENPQLARFRLDDHRNLWQVDVSARTLRFVITPGNGREAVTQLTAISGRQPVPPAWALGPTVDRETQLGESAAAYLAAVKADLSDIPRYRLPVRGYRIEGWAILPRAALRTMIAKLRTMRIHPLVYFRPFVSDDAASTEAPGSFRYAIAHRLVARTRSGAPYLFGDSFGGRAALLDFTNPATVRWWRARLRAALDLGVDGFMQDFCEEVQPRMRFHDGESGLEDAQPLPDHLRARHAARDRAIHAGPSLTPPSSTRAPDIAGRRRSAAYEGGNFAGDETTDWTHSSGLQSVIPDMLNRAGGGAYGYSTDIGGYFDLYPQAHHQGAPPPMDRARDLTPFFRLHGSLLHGVHLPWTSTPRRSASQPARAAARARGAPDPQVWRDANRTGVPRTRPLWLAYPWTAKPPIRTRNGSSVLTCSSRRSSNKARPDGASTSPPDAGARPTANARLGAPHRAGRRTSVGPAVFIRCGRDPGHRHPLARSAASRGTDSFSVLASRLGARGRRTWPPDRGRTCWDPCSWQYRATTMDPVDPAAAGVCSRRGDAVEVRHLDRSPENQGSSPRHSRPTERVSVVRLVTRGQASRDAGREATLAESSRGREPCRSAARLGGAGFGRGVRRDRTPR